ncbi:MAG: hypothetical protein MZU97_15570 [Bacillus subtilis]|nr:hypothetical protein [Bacillus subtilis]
MTSCNASIRKAGHRRTQARNPRRRGRRRLRLVKNPNAVQTRPRTGRHVRLLRSTTASRSSARRKARSSTG